jgi:membrane AbrB-like protein
MKFEAGLPLKTFWAPLAFACLGGYLANIIDIPGGWLIGAMFATIIFVMSGREVIFPVALRDVLFVILGVMFGSSMNPAMLSGMAKWPLSMALVVITMIVIVLVSMLYFRWIAKWDAASALLASIPGALSHVMAVASESGADIKRVAISQSTRIFMLAALVPVVLNEQPPSSLMVSQLPISLMDIGFVAVAGFAGAYVFKMLRIPGALITGATLASGLLFANEIVSGSFQFWQTVPGYILLGMMVGSRMSGISLKEYRKYLVVSVGAFSIVFLISALGALLASRLLDISYGLALLAFAPGAFEAMAALALAINYDPAFIIAHHMVRFFGIILMTPVFLLVLLKVSRKK